MNFDRIADTLKNVKTGKFSPRRHHDDEYWDEITIHAKHVGLGIRMIPRYKMSGLSGDEWRVSARIEVNNRNGDTVLSNSFGAMKWAIQFVPNVVWKNCKEFLAATDAVVTVSRKGYDLWSGRFDTFADAAIGLPWHVCHASESDSTWKHLTDDQERQHCQQVSCNEPPVNVFEFVKVQEERNAKLTEPEYDFTPRYTWFCERHTTRGDCGLEDADKNLILVRGPGVGRMRASDESESLFGGVIEVDLKPE